MDDPNLANEHLPGYHVFQAKRAKMLFDPSGNVLPFRLRFTNFEPPLDKNSQHYKLR